jgi:hypothetical protein
MNSFAGSMIVEELRKAHGRPIKEAFREELF